MPQEYIEIRGARENNLKNASLRIPERKIADFYRRFRFRQIVDRV